MIGYLNGKVLYRDKEGMIVDCNGVGYAVRSPLPLLRKAEDGEKIEMYIYTHVKEDALALYGFEDMETMRLFEKLILVPGIGPKTALGIFNVHKSEAVKEAVLASEVEFFTKVPGIGKKGAQKIIIDLKPRLGGKDDLDLSDTGKENSEVVMALQELGFLKREAIEAVKKVDSKKTLEEQIKEALRYV